jgi:hypothetical protein
MKIITSFNNGLGGAFLIFNFKLTIYHLFTACLLAGREE